MPGTQNHLSQTLVNQMDALVEETKESSMNLLDTIIVPRGGLQLITPRLPKANYKVPTLHRNASVPSRIGQISGLSNKHSSEPEKIQEDR